MPLFPSHKRLASSLSLAGSHFCTPNILPLPFILRNSPNHCVTPTPALLLQIIARVLWSVFITKYRLRSSKHPSLPCSASRSDISSAHIIFFLPKQKTGPRHLGLALNTITPSSGFSQGLSHARYHSNEDTTSRLLIPLSFNHAFVSSDFFLYVR